MKAVYALDVYTDFYITLKGASEMTAFLNKYESYMEDVAAKLKKVGEKQSVVRYNSLVTEATEKLDKAKGEYADAKEEAETKLADALKEIEDGKTKIADSEVKLKNARNELAAGEAKLAKERANYEKQMSDSEGSLKKILKMKLK